MVFFDPSAAYGYNGGKMCKESLQSGGDCYEKVCTLWNYDSGLYGNYVFLDVLECISAKSYLLQ